MLKYCKNLEIGIESSHLNHVELSLIHTGKVDMAIYARVTVNICQFILPNLYGKVYLAKQKAIWTE